MDKLEYRLARQKMRHERNMALLDMGKHAMSNPVVELVALSFFVAWVAGQEMKQANSTLTASGIMLTGSALIGAQQLAPALPGLTSDIMKTLPVAAAALMPIK